MNRREFLRLSMMVTAAGLLISCDELAPAEGGEKIIVIGAGMAGLTAAKKLFTAGYQPLVLEGRDRIGGRTWTSRAWPDVPVDMGASWIHGIEGNPLTDLADEVGSERIATPYDDEALLYDSDGRLLNDADAEEIWTAGEEIFTEAYLSAKASILSDDYPLRDAAKDAAGYDSLSSDEKRYFEFLLNTTIEHELAADTTEISAKHFYDVSEYGGEDVIFKQGYIELVEHLADGLDIRLNQTVTAIEYGDHSVTVNTTNGVFEASHVIITVPLGVLKQDVIRFTPPLPVTKQEAINSLGMGLLNKTYLRFTEPFWEKEAGSFYYVPERQGEWSFWLNLWPYLGKPILLCFNAATFGYTLETLSDENTVETAMNTLRTIFGTNIPAPEGWQITRWASDPFAYGSYSFTAVGTDETTRAALASPINGRLFFAGEATAENHPSTVHGAHLSGLRAAEELLDTL